MKKTRLTIVMMIGALLILPWTVYGAFPEKPVTIIVGYAPGGTSDSMARILAEHAGRILGQKITVENRTGGGGIVCWTAVSKAEPDGYTLGIISNGTLTSKYVVKGAMYTYEDFRPMATLSIAGVHYLVKKGGPYDMAFPKLLDHIKKNPGKIKVGLSGTYNSNDFTRILLERAAGVTLPKIPFKGDSKVVPAVLGGHIALGQITGFPAAVSLYRAGKINSLAVSADKRDPAAPDVPTFEELGLGFSHLCHWAVAGPSGIPNDRAKILADAFKQAMDSPKMQEDFKKVGLPMVYENPEDTLKLWLSYDELYGKLSKELGIKPK